MVENWKSTGEVNAINDYVVSFESMVGSLD